MPRRGDPVFEAVKAALAGYGMVRAGGKVIVAVSGGPDSVALLHVLYRLRAELGFDLHVGHVNHRLRGEEACADADYVRRLAERLEVPVTVEEAPVADVARALGISVEEGGRIVRYRFYRRLLSEVGASKVALGHNRDDQAETVLMRLLRGSGPAGLAGMRAVRDGWIIRPLLKVPRSAIETYCDEHALEPRHDPSNREPIYLRNRIRNELIPLLEREFNPGLRLLLANLAEVMRAEDDLLADLAHEALLHTLEDRDDTGVGSGNGAGVRLDVGVVSTLSLALQRRVVRLAAARARGVRRAGLTFREVEEVLGLVGVGVGKAVTLGGGLVAWRDYRAVVLEELDAEGDKSKWRTPKWRPFAYDLPVPGFVAVPEAGLRIEAALLEAPLPQELLPDGLAVNGKVRAMLDADLVSLPLTVRSRREGDRFWPLGLGAEKKLKEYFIDVKVARRERDRIPLVTSDGRIAWVVGYRIDERFRVTPDTRRFLLLRVVLT